MGTEGAYVGGLRGPPTLRQHHTIQPAGRSLRGAARFVLTMPDKKMPQGGASKSGPMKTQGRQHANMGSSTLGCCHEGLTILSHMFHCG
jgi:hypothetical protein